MTDRFDIAVVGAGVVGLATARELVRRRPGTKLVVLEKEERVGQHQTGHCSGVVHSGLYYTPGSAKARTCVRGGNLLAELCAKHGIVLERCGKLVVAHDAVSNARLDELHRRGVANGVVGLELVGRERMREIEPNVGGLRGLWSPMTGIVDFVRVAEALVAEITAAGGEVRTRTLVRGLAEGPPIRVETNGQPVEASFVVTCAGLQSDRVARLSGGARDPRIVPFRGDYWVLAPGRRDVVRGLVYPVPDPAFPFLGVHFTRRPDGAMWLGPTAVLALAREGDRGKRFVARDAWSALTHPGLYRLAARHLGTGLGEMLREVSRRAVLTAARQLVPDLSEGDLEPGPSGTRAQALGKDGRLVDDFVVERRPGIVHVRNAPSPAATASLAIAEQVADMALT